MTENDNDVRHDIRPLVRRLGKAPQDWRRADLANYCLAHDVRIVNFRYPSLDGKLKELRLPVNDRNYLERILAAGERVDGSSLFPGLLETGASDLYVVPVYRWAFVNPWAPDELDVVCRFADQDGAPCPRTPDNLLARLADDLRQQFDLSLQALTELEFYLILDRTDDRFTGRSQRNYHQSAPYLHGLPLADEILRVTSEVTGQVKYCHSEVGYIDRLGSHDPELHGKRVEQYELEFDLMPVEDLACWTAVARWLVRVVADRHHQSATFLPKLDEDMAGSGLHVHLALYRDGRNVMHGAQGELSDEAMQMIGGVLSHAGPLTAFGNTVAASYLRLVPDQEAPTRICWGYRNRSSLIRVPLGFDLPARVDQLFNPAEDGDYPAREVLARPTVEFRSPDGSAMTYLMLTAIIACVRDGLSRDDTIELARQLRVDGNIFTQPEVLKRLASLPAHAVEAAQELDAHREFFIAQGFTSELIDIVVDKLMDEDDDELSEKLRDLPAAERLKRSRILMHKDVHKH
ncbi:glutamine synthetase [bacterium]|nr:glutamine synthetase [bacterium]